jgi:hypothetical protein
MYVSSGTRSGITDANWLMEDFQGQASLERPVVLAAMQTLNDPTPSAIRIKDLTSTSFSFQVEEEISRQAPPAHRGERVGYIAFRDLERRPQGSRDGWSLHGVIPNVGEAAIETFAQTDASWQDITREARLGSVALFPQVLTREGSDPVHTRINDVHDLHFSLKMEEFSAGQGVQPGSEHIHPAEERVGWVALAIGAYRIQQASVTRALQLEVGTTQASTSDWTPVSLASRYLTTCGVRKLDRGPQAEHR